MAFVVVAAIVVVLIIVLRIWYSGPFVLRIWYSITIDVTFTTFFQRSFNFIFTRVFRCRRALSDTFVECRFRLTHTLGELGQLLRAEEQHDNGADKEGFSGAEHSLPASGGDYCFGHKR